MTTARRSTTGQTRNGQLEKARVYVQAGRYNTKSLAVALGTSLATAARLVEALRGHVAREGGRLIAVRTKRGWHYEVRESEARTRGRWRRFWSVAEAIWGRRSRPARLKAQDEAIYGTGAAHR